MKEKRKSENFKCEDSDDENGDSQRTLIEFFLQERKHLKEFCAKQQVGEATWSQKIWLNPSSTKQDWDMCCREQLVKSTKRKDWSLSIKMSFENSNENGVSKNEKKKRIISRKVIP